MAFEKYTTLGATTLNGAINNSTTSVVVTSAASLPSAGNFRINIENEIMKVTTVSGTTLTVTRGQEGTSGASHADSSIVTEVLTASALDAIRGDLIQTSTDTSKTSDKAGNIYLPSDGFNMYRDTGSAFAPWGPIFPFTAPDNSAYAWINQGSATVTTTNGGIVLFAPTSASENWRIRKKTAPATPYTITIAFLAAAINTSKFGVCFRQSSDGKLHALQLEITGGNLQFASQKMTNPTTFSANYATFSGAQLALFSNCPWWFQISDNGTSRICRVSSDGINWQQFDSQTRTDFLTADEVGFYCTTNTTGSEARLTLLHWAQS